ncbi:TPA: hypothetical protein SAN82_001027 [Pseudomonas putida]|nr:hypothetical protein [Pseudomonas putida]
MSQSVDYIIYGVQAQKDWTDWLAVAMSAIPAFVALWFTFRQNSLTKKHNKLMVKPHLDDLVREDVHSLQYEYSITNNGIGPAIVVDIKIFVDGLLVDSEKTLPEIIMMLFPEIKDDQFGHHSIAVGSYLTPEKDISIVIINCASKEILLRVKETVGSRAKLIITYESIYGDRQVFQSHPSAV